MQEESRQRQSQWPAWRGNQVKRKQQVESPGIASGPPELWWATFTAFEALRLSYVDVAFLTCGDEALGAAKVELLDPR
jgi:hypothetical protein